MCGKAVYFEDVDIGDEITPLPMNPTRETIAAYVKACHITEKRFTDDAYAHSLGMDGIIKPGAQLTCKGLIVEKHVRGSQNSIECDVFIENEHGDRPVTGSATVLLPPRA